jgi:hypothetical protein
MKCQPMQAEFPAIIIDIKVNAEKYINSGRMNKYRPE